MPGSKRHGRAMRGAASPSSPKEVRILAQRSAEAAKQIKELIAKSTEEVKSGVTLVGETGTALEAIIGDVEDINKNVLAIVEATREQSIGLGEINTAVASIDQGTQQNAAMVEETSAASVNLATQADELNTLLASFRLGTDAATRPQRHHRAEAASTPAPAAPRHAFNGSAALAAAPVEDWQAF